MIAPFPWARSICRRAVRGLSAVPDPAPSSPAHSSRHGALEHAARSLLRPARQWRWYDLLVCSSKLYSKGWWNSLETRLGCHRGVATGDASGLTGWGEHLYCTTFTRTWQARSRAVPDHVQVTEVTRLQAEPEQRRASRESPRRRG